VADEARRSDADDLQRLPVDRERVSECMVSAAKVFHGKGVTDRRDRQRRPRAVGQTTGGRRGAEHLEVVRRGEYGACDERLAAHAGSHGRFRKCGEA